MSGIELLPPDIEISSDINVKLRIRILSQVLYELTDLCGYSCVEYIRKGIFDRQIIEKITLSFFDSNDIIKGEIIFKIDWDKFEFNAMTGEDVIILQNIDINRLVSPQLDPVLYNTLKQHVIRLKKTYGIVKVWPYFNYRTKYNANKDVLNAYLGLINNYETPKRDEKAMNYDLQVTFQGLGGCLDIIMRT